MTRRTRSIQALFEALIPVLGYFLWDWNLYFILLYYFFELLADEVMLWLKLRSIGERQQKSGILALKRAFGSMLVFILSLLIIHFAIYVIYPDLDFKTEFIRFWNYTELGIAQGYVLLPLIGFAAYQQYKMNFLMMNGPERFSMHEVWKKQQTKYFYMIALSAFVLGLSHVVIFDEVIYVVSVVSLSTIYKFQREQ